MARPISVRIGMFWRLGLLLESRPVAAPAWLNDVCRRPVSGSISFGRTSTYVDLNFVSFR